MSQFDERESAAEQKFQLDQESEFRAQARRAKLLGRWAAELIGLTGEDADGYAKTVIIADLEEAGEEDLFRKIHDDLVKAGIAQTEQQIRNKMADLLDEARRQIATGS